MQKTDLRHEQIWLAVGSLMILATVALAAALIYTRDVMVPFVLAIFMTAVVAPVVDFQVNRWRLPNWLAVLTTLLLVLVVLALLSVGLILALQAMVNVAREYSSQVVDLTQQFIDKLESWKIQVDEARIISELESRLPALITQTAGTVRAIVSHGLLIAFFVVFLLVGRDPHRRLTGIYANIENTIRRYVTTMTLLSVGTSVLVGLVLWSCGLQLAWLFALLVFILNYIPNVGSIVATCLPIPVAVAQYKDPWMVLAVILIPGAIHMTVGNLIAPKLMGRDLELHPVTVLLALAFWGLLWGILGMILAVPIVAMIKIVLAQFQTTQPIANLLAGHLPGSTVAVAPEGASP